MTILAMYQQKPEFPATDQAPGAVRYQIGALWIDAVGPVPTQADVDAIVSPDINAVDVANISAILAQPGAIERAMGLVMFNEINVLRTALALPPRTMPQFLAALKAQIR